MFRVDVKSVTRWARQGKLTFIRTLGGHRRYKEPLMAMYRRGTARSRRPRRTPGNPGRIR